ATIYLDGGTFTGGFTIGRSVTIQGRGQSSVITGLPKDVASGAEVTVADAAVVTLRNLTVDGRGVNPDVVAGRSSLNIIDSTIRGGRADVGGGISVNTGTGGAKLSVVRSTISGNAADGLGGGIDVSTGPR